jgi:transposase-like protein
MFGGVNMAKQETYSFMDFKKIFNNEDACRKHLFIMKWPDGFKCPKCGNETYYEITTRNLYECSSCHYQASVIVNTVMERTHIKLEKWFWAIYFIGKDKRGCSATMLSKELEISYKAAWFMLHRIRKAMKDRDSNYLLAGVVELDDAYFGAPQEGGKRGRGTDKSKVMVGLSLNEKGNPQFIKMEVINDLKKETIAKFAQENIENGSTISSDAYRSYNSLKDEGFKLEAKVFNSKNDENHLKWLHTIVSNAKAFIAGTFHGLDDKHLQKYLDEFCFRFNRRFFEKELFNRIVNSCMNSQKLCFTELTK